MLQDADSFDIKMLELGGRKMTVQSEDAQSEVDPIIQELIELERQYYFEKRNVKTERQRKLRELIERHTPAGGTST